MWKLILLLVLLPPSLLADGSDNWASKVHEVKLSNGMKFILYERGEAPIFSAFIRFRAGGIDEEAGKTGLAHFLEHMAFKGTSTLGTTDYGREKVILDQIEVVGEELASEYKKRQAASRGTSLADAREGRQVASADKIKTLRGQLKALHQQEEKYLVREAVAKKMADNGGNDQNATTSKDMTSYFVSMPSDKLRFWAEIESERIFRPVFREFYEEKDVVLEERRMRVDNDPDGRLYEAFLEKAFEKSPYRWPTIGSAEDIQTLTVGDLRDFWGRRYRPSNAVGALVGRFDIPQAEVILQETFGRIRVSDEKQGLASEYPPKYPEDPPQQGEKRVEVSLNARPRILIGYHKPTLPKKEDYVFDLIEQILGEGRSSRLYRSLVLGKKLVSNVGTATNVPGSMLSNLFLIELAPLEGRSVDRVLKAVDAAIDAIRRESVTARELDKAKNRLMVEQLWALKTDEGMASQLSSYQTVAGDWRYLENYLKTINNLTSEDVRKVASYYLDPKNRTISILKPLKDQ